MSMLYSDFPLLLCLAMNSQTSQGFVGSKSFYYFLLLTDINVVRDISCRVSQREVFPKAGVTRVSPGEGS